MDDSGDINHLTYLCISKYAYIHLNDREKNNEQSIFRTIQHLA